MAQAFYQTGEGKIANFANAVSFFTDLGIRFPEANAFFVSRLEFWGGLLLVAGLATRLVAGALASTMVVALATADRRASSKPSGARARSASPTSCPWSTSSSSPGSSSPDPGP